MLYAPIYYRLQIGTGPINEVYTDGIFEQVMEGLSGLPAGVIKEVSSK
jgi:hypothetical protein